MKMTTLRALRLAVSLGLLSAGGGASAIQYSWDLNKAAGTTSSTGGYLSFTSTYGSQTLKVYAYETNNTNGTGKLYDAKVVADGSWGLGVLGSSSDEGSYPGGLTLDNDGKDEVLVFDAGVDNYDWDSLTLGFKYTGSTSADSSPELKYWAGNGTGAGFDFNNFCLSATSCTGTVLAGNGFTASETLAGLTVGTPKALTTNNTGRYLVVSGELPTSGGFEKVKISSISGTAPEPQSIALLGIGLLAMLGLRRRSSKAEGRRTELGFA